MNESLLIEIIKDFESQASKLIMELATKFHVEIDAVFPAYSFIAAKRQQGSGALDEEWDYWFHGFECQFENKTNGHIIDVKLKYPQETGALDPQFLGQFIQTHPMAWGVSIKDPYRDGLAIMDFLGDAGVLEVVSTEVEVDLNPGTDYPMYFKMPCRAVRRRK